MGFICSCLVLDFVELAGHLFRSLCRITGCDGLELANAVDYGFNPVCRAAALSLVFCCIAGGDVSTALAIRLAVALSYALNNSLSEAFPAGIIKCLDSTECSKVVALTL